MEVTDKLLAEGFLSKAGAVIGWEGQVRAHSFGDFGYTKPAMHVERERFDQILFEHAAENGVTTVEEATVTGVDLTAAEESGEGAVVAVKAEDGTSHAATCWMPAGRPRSWAGSSVSATSTTRSAI